MVRLISASYVEPQTNESPGPISSVTVFGQNIIVVNDLQMTIDLLDKKSSIFSDRPIFPFIGGM